MSFSAGGWKRGLQRSLPTELLYNFITEISCYRMKSDYCKKAQICFNDIALYYCKAEKASLKNYRVRKYNTQCYTAPSISTDDNCTKYVHEDQHLDRKILFLPYQCKRTSIFVLLCSDNTHVCLDRGDTLQQSCL